MATDSRNPGQSPTVPKRFWWTKRVFLAWVLLVAAVPVSRFVWGWLADRRMAAAEAAMAAQGVTMEWPRKEPPPPAPVDNAATYYNNATDALDDGDRDLLFLLDVMRVPSLREKYIGQVDAVLAANDEVFANCRAARDAKGVNRRALRVLPVPTGGHYRPWLYPDQVRLLLCLRAARQAELGQSAWAIETLLDVEAYNRAWDQSGPDLRVRGTDPVIVPISVTDAAVEWVAARLTIGEPGTDEARRPATAQSVRQLIAVLMDGQAMGAFRRDLIRGNAADYARICSWTTALTLAGAPVYQSAVKHVPGWPDKYTWLLEPMIRYDKALWVCHWAQDLDAIGQPTMALAKPRLSAQLVTETLNSPKAFTHPHTDLLWTMAVAPGFWRTYMREIFELDAWSRLEATALALRLYEFEKGRRAESLAELVPEYLPALPVDPLDPAGGPIRALLTDAKPRLYGFGVNMKDDGGTTRMIFFPRPHRVTADVVLYLRPGDRPEPDMNIYRRR